MAWQAGKSRGLIGVLIAASFWIMRPFFLAVIWATMIVMATWPMILRFQARGLADFSLPLLLIFAGVLGGLIAFGTIGLFIGPVVLAVTFKLLESWVAGDEHQP